MTLVMVVMVVMVVGGVDFFPVRWVLRTGSLVWILECERGETGKTQHSLSPPSLPQYHTTTGYSLV